ncbi:GAF and ANTAR domain-containing protein [Solwaraspora sp. WMMD406]|uniref:GAF and ANTAR domain-containing protein n=1 Tax=Solwaraspora sp. WMMD406 TaxID=3016095 RepID=UPI002416CAC6|nr:GAF and ANTAR domain-containing protein [Solwaraspora sp. WMMD406]MDG4766286.1 GAF and ANTAR domain-containing protein [Solwaraspora sp. WMMD406]
MIRCVDFDDALDHLAGTTRHALPAVAYASVCVLRAGQPASVTASDPLIKDLDELQYAADGPAMTAIRDREIVFAPSLTDDRRWPRWTSAAAGRGIHAVLCAPVDVDEEAIGSINLYAERPGALAAREQLTAMLLAEHAGLLLSAVRDRAREADRVDPTRPHGDVISQAIGVVMTQRRCRAEQALEVLQDAAAATAIPLAEVAERLVSSVERTGG